MKTSALIMIVWFLASTSYGQSSTTKIYLVKNGLNTINPFQCHTTLDPTQTIKVKNNGYVLIEMNADSLGLINDYAGFDDQGMSVSSKPVFINVERGKSYFFKIGPAPAFRGSFNVRQHTDVEEMTERAFWLYIGLNELGDKPTKYVLTNAPGLAKGQ